MIIVQNINKIYRSGDTETAVLKDVSFSIEDGEFVAIMGPSGSGKSTLMHILGCLDTPTSGTYEINGENTTAASTDRLAELRKRTIGFVFQSFHLLPRATVIKNVMLPLVYAHVPKIEREAAARQALTAAAFPEKFWQYQPNQLSGGMMQRVAIARALVNNPKVLLADEPTGNLDSATGAKIIETFQQLHRLHGRTIVLITHERSVAEHAERILELCDGRLVADQRVTDRRFVSQIFAHENA